MTTLLVDRVAFDADSAMQAAIRARTKLGGITDYTVVEEWDGLDPLYYWYNKDIEVLTEPARYDYWRLFLEPGTNVILWALEWHDVDHTRARAIVKAGKSTKYAWELSQARYIEGRFQAGITEYYKPVLVPVEAAPGVEVRPGRDYKLLSEEELDGFIRGGTRGMVTLDFETVGSYPLGLVPDGYSFSFVPGTGYYVPMRHTHESVPNVGLDAALRGLRWITSQPWIAHNAKFELQVLRCLGITPAVEPDDTMLLAYHLGLEKGLKVLSREILGEQMDTYEDVTMSVPFAGLDRPRVLNYACADADMTLRLWPILKGRMADEQWRCYWDIDKPLIGILADMEWRGVSADEAKLVAWEERLVDEICLSEMELQEVARINWASGEQVSDLLFNKLGLDPQKFKTKGYATDQPTLDILRGTHPVVERIIKNRELKKALGTYAEGMQRELKRWPDRRIRAPWNQVRAKTGRLSSGGKLLGEKSLNLQNLPKLGKDAVVPGPGKLLVGADYEQIELRVMAHISQDKALLSDFNANISPHIRTMQAVFGFVDKTTPQYTLSKNINFGTIFGVGADKLVAQALEGGVNVDSAETGRWLAVHHDTYPDVWRYIENVKKYLAEFGWTETISGHRAYYPDVYSYDLSRRGSAEREGVNHTIQGEAAYRAKRAMVEWTRRAVSRQAPLVINEHDALIVEADAPVAEEAGRALERVMIEAFEGYSLPITTEAFAGATWLQVKLGADYVH